MLSTFAEARSKFERMPSATSRGDALAVGRYLVQRVAAVILTQRRDPFGLEGGQVGLGSARRRAPPRNAPAPRAMAPR